MKLLITTLICFFAAFQSSNAQVVKSEWDNTSWTDGITEYKAKVLNSSQVLMIGSGYFDAGYGSVFQIQKVKDNEWRMSVLPNNNVVLPANYADFLVLNELPDGISGTRRIIDGNDVIIRMDNGKATNAFVKIKSGKSVADITKAQVIQSIVGNYTDKNGLKYSFSTDGNAVFGGKATKYEVLKDHSVPSQIIKLKNGNIYEVKPTLSGMIITEGNYDKEVEEFTSNGKQISITADNTTPRWAWLSNSIFTEYHQTHFPESKKYIRLMRNEIWARHGYRFTDPELNTYFSSCKWYHPVNDNNTIKLTDIESFNILILKDIENKLSE